MRKFILLLLILGSTIFSKAQDRHEIDSLNKVLNSQKDDTLKVKTLYSLGWEYIFNKPDSAYMYGKQLLQLTQKLNFRNGDDMAYEVLFGSLFVKGNYFQGIELLTQRLRTCEETNHTDGIVACLKGLFNCYRDMGDHKTALQCTLRAIRITDSLGTTDWDLYMNLGNAYDNLNQMDSALMYSQKAYQGSLAKKVNHPWIPYILGNINAKLHNYELAMVYYHMSASTSLNANNYKNVIDNYNAIATLFKERNQSDSVIYYSKEALNFYKIVSYKKGAMEAAANLAQAYKIKNINDSTLKYFELSATLKDSLYNQEKIMQVQNLAFSEQLRQQELERRQIKESEERKQNIQYAGIALGLVTLVILFFLLSHSVVANEKLIKFLGILSLLIFFEFINLVIHPYLNKITDHSAILTLAIMVCVAALLIPLHHRLEKWITERLVDKNKRIRLTAAKKTIAKLEGELNHD